MLCTAARERPALGLSPEWQEVQCLVRKPCSAIGVPEWALGEDVFAGLLFADRGADAAGSAAMTVADCCADGARSTATMARTQQDTATQTVLRAARDWVDSLA